MSAPITYTGTPINDDYVFTSKKYAISNGRPGSTGFINYRNNPNSKTWYPAYNYNQYHPNGTGYYIISNTRVQGGHATAGNEIPTFQVTGSTDAAILHLINRLQNRTTFYTNVAIAKDSIIADPESLHFDADLSKYNYYAPQFCLLNFDAGNLNCNYKSDDDRLRNLTDVAVALLPGVGAAGAKTSAIDNASFYRVMQFDESLLSVTSGGSSLVVDDAVEYVVAMRIRIPTLPIGSMEILSIDFTAPFNPDFKLFYDFTAGFVLLSNGASVSIGNVSTDFITIIFGRVGSQLFLHTNDATYSSQTNSSTYTPNKVDFAKLKLSSQLNPDLLFIGALQVWSGALSIDISNGTMSGVSQSDFFNQIHTMYAGRWS
jgi:hypothetical protein